MDDASVVRQKIDPNVVIPGGRGAAPRRPPYLGGEIGVADDESKTSLSEPRGDVVGRRVL